MKSAHALICLGLPLVAAAQSTVNLPEVTVYSPRVANQSPAGTIAMPVSALRFEPGVDIQSRNLAEGQADVTLRGGIFENTGFQVGAVTVIDPQTGHYLAELPVAPALLTAPEIRTGSQLALSSLNANVGSVAYGWRPIRTAGVATLGMGEFSLRRGEIYQGVVAHASPSGGAKYGVDFDAARSESDGAIPFGEHKFERFNIRMQRVAGGSQTDLFAGYQSKQFGWPNMYTPFNSNESENLHTNLFALNHRTDLGKGEFIEAGAYHRRNKDDYAFNRFAPLTTIHPFQHTTWVSGAAVGSRRQMGNFFLNGRAEALADELHSSSLTFGRYNTRTLTKIVLAPEKEWRSSDGSRTSFKLGAAYEDSNRDGGTVSPLVELAREFSATELRRVYVSYVKTSQLPTYTALNSSAAAGLFRGNPNLGREMSHNIELGSAANLGGWDGSAAIFWRRDERLVDWTFRNGVTARSANAVDVDVTGLEIVARRSWKMCDVVLGYTALAKDADYRGAIVDASFYALNYARHRLTAAFTARISPEVVIRVDNVGRIQADNSLRVRGGDHALSTAVGLAYRPRAVPGFEISAQVDNLWNSYFQEIPAVPATRRQFSAGVSYAW